MPPPNGTKIAGTDSLDKNYLSANAKWHKGTGKVHNKGSRWGVCFAMTGMWIREALRGLGPKAAAEQLGQHKQRVCICQGLYNIMFKSNSRKSGPTMGAIYDAEAGLLKLLDLKVVGGMRSDDLDDS